MSVREEGIISLMLSSFIMIFGLMKNPRDEYPGL
jgi:hypothetical protein